MQGKREPFQLPRGQSFRLLQWANTVADVEVLQDRGSTVSLAGKGAQWHYHSAMELTLFRSGRGTRFVGDDIALFQAGDLVLLGEGLPHYWHCDEPSSGVSVQWDFPKDHAFWTFPETHSLLPLFARASRGIHLTGRTASAVAIRMSELTAASDVDRLGLLLRLMAILVAAPIRERKDLASPAFVKPDASDRSESVAEAVRYLISNFRTEVSLDDVLHLTGMSKPTFSRQFKRYCGKTYSEFLLNVRLQAVLRDLVATDRSILDISMSNGFTQLSFFNRAFRRIIGCTPTAFKARRGSKVEMQP